MPAKDMSKAGITVAGLVTATAAFVLGPMAGAAVLVASLAVLLKFSKKGD